MYKSFVEIMPPVDTCLNLLSNGENKPSYRFVCEFTQKKKKKNPIIIGYY